MKISRRFTKSGQSVYDTMEWTRRSSRIGNADGSTVFEMKDAEIPASWSQLATDIVVSKYFRKAGVPQTDAQGNPLMGDDGRPLLGPESSVRQVVHRLAGCWAHWGEKFGYFSSRRDTEAFYDELAAMLLDQVAAPNSPQWFNTGLNFAYGITGPAQGHWIADHNSGHVHLAGDAYTHPQPHACFIQSVRDDLVGEGGIMDLWVREARLFKYGSGTGTNFSALRGDNEPLSGGGRSSGLMSFLKIGDRAAGAIKSGGTTRRAAKMVCLDVDHPDIEAFVNWKVREELKVAALVEGMKHLTAEQKEVATRLGLTLNYDFNGESYYTVSGQNSNNSVRLSDEFMDAVIRDADWTLVRRTDGKVAKTIKARDLWEQINLAAWHCADPGVQFDSTINAWHTCPAGGRINASNPCSEYMFLDNTACNLASINLLKFYDSATRTFDIDGFEHAIGLWTIVLEISVLMASFPSKEIAELSWRYRTLGLGYANLGAMLMQAGIPYDSDAGRAVCSALTAILTGRSYATSALLAAEHGPFAGFEANRDSMLKVMRNHRRAALGIHRDSDEYESLRIRPVPIDHDLFHSGPERSGIHIANADGLLRRAVAAWDDAVSFGEKFGYRNAQVTVIAPTGTIGLLMDCDTTGVEPDFALTKFKKLAGGGYFKIANQSLRPALTALGYEAAEVDEILTHVMGSLSLDVAMPAADGATVPTTGGSAPATFRSWLLERGYTHEELVKIENQLPTFFELGFAFSAWSIPDRLLRERGVDPDALRRDPARSAKFDGLRTLGATRKQIASLNRTICGTQTVEGAPHLRAEHLAVFDCANRCGPTGERFIRPEGHIRMMAAAQPFISGAISKTINLPNEAAVTEIGDCYRLSWELGLKANALYRDGSKLSQPLSTKSDAEKDADEDVADDEELLAAAVAEHRERQPASEAARAGTPNLRPTPSPAGGRVSGLPSGESAAETAATSTSPTSSIPTPAVREILAEASIRADDVAQAAASAAEIASLIALEQRPGLRDLLSAPAIGAGQPLHASASAEPVYIEVERIVERIIERPMRRRLPDTRESITHKFNVAGHEGYLIVGLYEDGRPGELFITMAKEGSTIGGLMDSLGTAISVALQYGVPVESLVNKFAHQRFEPMGMTTNRDIPFAKSLVDYIFRWFGMQFISGYRDQNAPKRETPSGGDHGDAPSTPPALHHSLSSAPAGHAGNPRHEARHEARHEESTWSHRSQEASGSASRSPAGLSPLGGQQPRPSQSYPSQPAGSAVPTAHRGSPAAGCCSPAGSSSQCGAGHETRTITGAAVLPQASGGGPAVSLGGRISMGNPTAESLAAVMDRPLTSRSAPDAAGSVAASVLTQPTEPARDAITETFASVESTRTVTTSRDARTAIVTESTDVSIRSTVSAGNALDQLNATLMGDAPACDVCGSITVRNGTCYRCSNCGNSMGCS
jgi:ribonucleoside-diphosphate reductase alpha chain